MDGGGSGGGPSASSSGGEEDGDANWKAAIDSVAAVGFGLPASNGSAGECSHGKPREPSKTQDRVLKLYQIKARKMLDDFLDKNLEVVRTPGPNFSGSNHSNGGGIKLFKKAPPGMTLDDIDRHHVQLKRPRILPGEEVEEKSKKFKQRLKSVAVDGNDIIVSATEACQRSLARFEAKEAAAKAAAKREEDRVKELKRTRGEKWLPSIARQMKERAKTH